MDKLFCDNTITLSQILKHHLKEDKGADDKQFTCSVCDKKFSKSAARKRHEQLHTNGKPYSCSKCDSKFAHASSLKNHDRIHNCERPFKCSRCEKTFITFSHLKRHEIIHTDDKQTCSGKKARRCLLFYSEHGGKKKERLLTYSFDQATFACPHFSTKMKS